MSSERCKRALDALKSDAMPYVIYLAVLANSEDNFDRDMPGVSPFNRTVLSDRVGPAPYKVRSTLTALSDSYVDALIVLMYAGRDEFMPTHQYDELDIDTQFSSWWDYLGMDGERFAREQMVEKTPLGLYLRSGAYMFRVINNY